MKDYSIRRIEAALDSEFDTEDRKHVVPAASIARIIKSVPRDAPLVPWGFGWPSDPEGIAHLLALYDHAARYAAPFGPMSIQTAEWALRLRVALGPINFDDDIERHWLIAHDYSLRERERLILGHDKADTFDLDCYVMARPWESDERTALYSEMVGAGTYPEWSLERRLDREKLIDPKADLSRVREFFTTASEKTEVSA